ncbi:MAG: NAD(P)H-dependent oxidoreductase [Nocardioidaceae bacterium]|nr:NAD(P)H-dependent oxidoreductase [Nocardioidaceae bacterium]
MKKTAQDHALRIALIVASVRQPRVADSLLAWLTEALAAVPWLDLEVIDLATVDLGAESSPIAGRLAAADAFLLLTPEYNHSFPGPLKIAIDRHLAEWAYKPVAFVGYGAGAGGARAVEQLRVVFPELRATTTREAVLLTAPWERLDECGRFLPDEGIEAALAGTMTELRWWAEALRARRDLDRVGAA